MIKTLFTILSILATCNSALAAESFPQKPTGKVLDEAHILTATDIEKINAISNKLSRDQQTPITVVTIDSLADYNAQDLGIEKFALAIFNKWGIGRQDFNYGTLLLISNKDRQARIEFGASFNHRYDTQAEQIMSDVIVYNFKKGDFSKGTLEAVESLDSLLRGMPLPSQKFSTKDKLIAVGVLILIIGIAYSLFKNGKSGWGWIFLAAVGAALLYSLLRRGRGGSGGGGGASGRW